MYKNWSSLTIDTSKQNQSRGYVIMTSYVSCEAESQKLASHVTYYIGTKIKLIQALVTKMQGKGLYQDGESPLTVWC